MKTIWFNDFLFWSVCSKTSCGRVEISLDRLWMGKKIKEQKVFKNHRYALKIGVTRVFVVYFRSTQLAFMYMS